MCSTLFHGLLNSIPYQLSAYLFFHFPQYFATLQKRKNRSRSRKRKMIQNCSHIAFESMPLFGGRYERNRKRKSPIRSMRKHRLLFFSSFAFTIAVLLIFSSVRPFVDGLFILSLFIFHFKLFHFSRFTSAKPWKVLVVFVIGVVVVVVILAACVVIVCPVANANDVLGEKIPLMLMGFDNAAAQNPPPTPPLLSPLSIVTAAMVAVHSLDAPLLRQNANCQLHFGRKFLFNMI